MDCSPPGSFVHGISQTRKLEWVAMPSTRDLPNPGTEPRSLALQADSLLSEPPGRPFLEDTVLNIHVVPVIRGVPQFGGAAQ